MDVLRRHIALSEKEEAPAGLAGRGDPIVLDGHRDFAGAVAWSPDGERLATTSEDGTLRV